LEGALAALYRVEELLLSVYEVLVGLVKVDSLSFERKVLATQ